MALAPRDLTVQQENRKKNPLSVMGGILRESGIAEKLECGTWGKAGRLSGRGGS